MLRLCFKANKLKVSCLRKVTVYYDLHPGWSTPLYVPLTLTHDVPFPHHTPHSSLFDMAFSWRSHPIGWHLLLMQTPRECCIRQGAPSGSLTSVLCRREVPVGMQWEIHMSSSRCWRCSEQNLWKKECAVTLTYGSDDLYRIYIWLVLVEVIVRF
jgi:hypothetical protein